MTHRARGIDVSEIDAVGDLKAAQAAGIDFVVVKVSEGKDFRDPAAPKFIADAKALQLPRAVYHFASATASGKNEAQWCLAACDAAGVDPHALVFLDWEINRKFGTMSIDDAREFVETVAAARGRCGLYVDEHMAKRITAVDDPLASCVLWLAYWADGALSIPPAWSGWNFWQYSDGVYGPSDVARYPRTVPGFPWHVDSSAYAGTPDAVRALLA